MTLEEMVRKHGMAIRGVLNIGGYVGFEQDEYERLGIRRVVWFEPVEANFYVLSAKVQGRAIAIMKALGNITGRVSMHVASNGMSSSVLGPKVHLTQHPEVTFDCEEMVDMVRLDEVGFDVSDCNFINIDVQGYELEVFKGGTRTLAGIDYILAEINRAELYAGCAMVGELVSFLEPYGFELVEQFWYGGTWGDGLFVKKHGGSCE